MNAKTIMSAKGQVVIPKDVRERLRLQAGDKLDVLETADGILLKRSSAMPKLSIEEALARLRTLLPRYEGPPVSVEDMNDTIRQMWIESALKSDHASDRH
jgi:AbrB family looped-hinge helix DNA binding protein